MSLKTIYFIIFLVLIEFSIKIKGNDENRNTPTQNAGTNVPNINLLEQLIKETNIRLTYVFTHWQEILPQDRNNIKAYNQLLRINKDSSQALTSQYLSERWDTLGQPFMSLYNSLKSAMAYHQLGVTFREQIHNELLRLQAAARQLIETENVVRQQWNEVPYALKNQIINTQLQIDNVIVSDVVIRPRRRLTDHQIIRNRYVYLQLIVTLENYYRQVLQHLANHRLLQGQMVSGGRGGPGQIMVSGRQEEFGQKRPSQNQGGSVSKRKRN